MTGSTTRPAPLPAGPDRRLTARLAGVLTLASLALTVAQQFVLNGPELVPMLVGAAGPVAMAAVVLMLARLRAAGSGRAARLGFVLWATAALLQIASVSVVRTEASGAPAWPWYAVSVAWLLSLTAGPLLAGVGIVRAGVLTGWRRWVPLAFGIAQILVFVPPMLGIYALFGIAVPVLLVFEVLLGVALFTAFRSDVTTSEWVRSGAVLETR